MNLEAIHPSFLIVTGDEERVEVLRSPVVRDDDPWLEPIRQFTEEHGLIPSPAVSFDDPDWMFGQVEVTIYAPALVAA